MGWEEVDDKLKRKLDSKFVSCDEDWELKYIKKVVKEEFPHFTSTEIEKAVNGCCDSVDAPRPRSKYLDCLKRKLGT